MHQLNPSPKLLRRLKGTTAIITGSGRGIGAATAALFNKHGANVVITDLPALQEQASSLIESLQHPNKAIFVPASVTEWTELVEVFKAGQKKFGSIDIVVANAAIMESRPVMDIDVDANGDPLESREANKVIDVNLRGALNTLRLSMHYMQRNKITEHGHRGSVVLVTSTSGYFGLTGNLAYIASKHGAVGLLRACQPSAEANQIRVNSIAPSFTPTHITAGFGDSLQNAGVESNTPEMVATAIAYAALDESQQGSACLVAGKFLRELEHTRKALMPEWLGTDVLEMMARMGGVMKDLGGFPLPQTSP
ncbi:3-hydroxyacyl-CoA dehydrogenase type-2, partial [Dactylonectria estremocensis]